MAEHLDPHTIITLALRGESHPHLSVCAACRTLHEQACSLCEYQLPDDTAVDHEQDVRFEAGTPRYRLAAQDRIDAESPVIVRRTWYLANTTVLLRVIEDRDEQCLHGHVITDPDRLARITIRFSGIDADFRPDESGMFRIGAGDLPVESMDAELIER